MSLIVLKSGQKMDDMVALAKGLIGPQDVANGGELTAQGASKLISMVFDDPFMKRVTTERMMRLTKNVDVIDLQGEQLVRVPEGEEPAADQMTGASEHGCKLTALEAQIFAKITLQFLRENKDNPELLKLIEKSLQTVMNNDLVKLGFVGVNDDGGGANKAEKFRRLNKGWLQIAREADATQKLVIDPATDTWVAALQSVVDAADERWEGDCVLLMNPKDASAYSREINAPVTGHEVHTKKPASDFEGKEIVGHKNMPRGTVLCTPLANLVFGMHVDVRRSRDYHKIKRAIEYVFDISFDYELAIKEAAVLAQPA